MCVCVEVGEKCGLLLLFYSHLSVSSQSTQCLFTMESDSAFVHGGSGLPLLPDRRLFHCDHAPLRHGLQYTAAWSLEESRSCLLMCPAQFHGPRTGSPLTWTNETELKHQDISWQRYKISFFTSSTVTYNTVCDKHLLVGNSLYCTIVMFSCGNATHKPTKAKPKYHQLAT